MLGHILLFATEFRRFREEVRRCGALVYFHAFRHRPASTAELFPGESPLRLLMVHDLYMALALTGGAEPIRASARLRPRSGGGIDLALVELEWAGGVWGSFTASYLTPPGMAGDGFDRLEAFGHDWAARLELNPRPLTVWAKRAEWPLALDIYDDPQAPSGWLAEELRHFCRVVRGQADVPFGARFEEMIDDIKGAGFDAIELWVAHLEPLQATPEMSAIRRLARSAMPPFTTSAIGDGPISR